MDIYYIISNLILFHVVLYLADYFLKHKSPKYHEWLTNGFGITIKPFQLHCTTTLFSRPLRRISLINSCIHNLWFNIGVVVVILGILPSIGIVISSLAQSLSKLTTNEDVPQSDQILQPMVPGVNVASSDIPFYVISFCISSLFHEIGHASAAIREGISVESFGLVLLFAFPGAYVSLPSSAVNALSPFKRLKILCGGVWHNVVIVVVAIIFIESHSMLMFPMYSKDGVVVTSMTGDSPVRGVTGLEEGDIVTSVNSCQVRDKKDWHNCLLENLVNPQKGFCLPNFVVSDFDETVHHTSLGEGDAVACCGLHTTSHLCFELMAPNGEDTGAQSLMAFTCLPARAAIARSVSTCTMSSECPNEFNCLAPSLDKNLRLLQVKYSEAYFKMNATRRIYNQESEKAVANSSKKSVDEDEYPSDNHVHTEDVPFTFNDILYLGSLPSLYQTVSVSDYIPRFWYVPYNLPEVLLHLSDYFIKFSGAIGLLNLVPCLYLDGQHILAALLEWSLVKHCQSSTIRSLTVLCTAFGTILLSITLILSFSTLL